jgi:hypothetical protein
MEQQQHSRRWWIHALLGLAQLMVVLDATIVNIALPQRQQDLGFSNDSRQWIVTAYALAFGSLLLLGGRLGDLFGRKRTLHRRPARLRRRLRASAARRRASACSSRPARCRASSARCSRRRARPADHDLHRPARARQGVRHLRRDRRRRRRDRPAARRHPHRVPVWRWCLYVNLAVRDPGGARRARLLQPGPRRRGPRHRHPRHADRVAGLFALVYGFSQRRDRRLGRTGDDRLARPPAVPARRLRAIERRVEDPLLPLRVVADRNRGGAYLAIGSRRRHVRRLPVPHLLPAADARLLADRDRARVPADVAAIMLTATTSTAKLVPRFGARPLIPTGMRWPRPGCST